MSEEESLTGLAERYREISRRLSAAVEARKSHQPATLVAVSKMHPAEAVEALYRLGHRDFGENYVQEMAAKAATLRERGCTDIRWHFIGHLQTNKAKTVAASAFAVHSVDSLKVGQELAKRWKAAGRDGQLQIFIEVNIGQESSKSGVSEKEVPALARQLAELPELELLGLMCIPEPGTTSTGEPFRRLRELEERCRPWTRGALSMGMTDDFEIAIREGASHVRIGTAIFGHRDYSQKTT